MTNIFDAQADTEGHPRFVHVILPLPLQQLYSYSIPLHLRGQVQPGQRVELPFGRQKIYAGLVHSLADTAPEGYAAKPILDVLDPLPLLQERHLRFWEWMSDYYLCSLGEIMQAALPTSLKLQSESVFVLHPNCKREHIDWESLDAKEALLLQELLSDNELSVKKIQQLLRQKSISRIVQKLQKQGLLFAKEELKRRYKAKTERMLRLAPNLREEGEELRQAFELLQRSPKQTEVFLAILQLTRELDELPTKLLQERCNCDSTSLRRLEERGLIELFEQEVSRISELDIEAQGNFVLSSAQKQSLDEIEAYYAKGKRVVLLHGLTGSGKTQIFVELMQKCLDEEKQVLYLLPEIALTTQLVQRLQKHFGDKVLVYHSRFQEQERVEIWQRAEDASIIVGARSCLFMPFRDLGLIVVDEEHDASYKQQAPAPRYNARDAAIFLGHQYKAKVLLGTATPSLESYQNCMQGKYGLVELKERYGAIALPKIEIIDLREETKQKRMKSHFSSALLQALEETIEAGKQSILFQNRRGYAPVYSCNSCGWTVECQSCDVSLTYHKYKNELSCHYCGHRKDLPKLCQACGSASLSVQGFGTEKIEEELAIFLPKARILRMDFDTVKGKDGHGRILAAFESKEVDILIGTQMVSKGLDFDNVGLVGILSADQLLSFPDFRASERAFQLMTQVSGRAGRKGEQGRVLVQAFQTGNPTLREVKSYNFFGFLQRELEERKSYQYPPFFRLIHIQLRHKDANLVELAAQAFGERLRQRLGHRVLGPTTPSIGRLRNYYLKDLLIKMGRNSSILQLAKESIAEAKTWLLLQKGYSQLRIVADVDPM